ncbi:hypothetical protein AX16_007106 [Volvariella volvacea WC 439]|nr:hypothetical protein AX16_007106 [Volvariella volvacea WC 439]
MALEPLGHITSDASAMNIALLPNEVLLKVFLYLSPISLKRCSLVSHQFLAIARHTQSLSVSILLLISNQPSRYKTKRRNRPSQAPIQVHQSLDSFLQLLNSSPSSFGSSTIRKLTLNVESYHIKEPSYNICTTQLKLSPRARLRKGWEVEAKKFVDILAKLSQLKELSLKIYWNQFWEELIQGIDEFQTSKERRILPCLQRLEIVTSQGQIIREFVSLMPDQLDDLHCTMIGSFDHLDFSNMGYLSSLHLTAEIELYTETALQVASHLAVTLPQVLSTIPAATCSETQTPPELSTKPLKLLTIRIVAKPQQMLILTDIANNPQSSTGPGLNPITFWRPFDAGLCNLIKPNHQRGDVGIEEIRVIYPMQHNIVYMMKWIQWSSWLIGCEENERIKLRYG